MSTILDIRRVDIIPEPQAVLALQGVPDYATGDDRLLAVARAAVDELDRSLEPAGVLNEVTLSGFAEFYPGQGFNSRETPLERIFPRAESLALFAVTCGQAVCDRIRDLFFNADYALGAALDAAASLAADQAAQIAQDSFASTLDGKSGVLRYSPGYCGWHVSGQKALFRGLGSQCAGIALNDSFLMRPLKSVSGVIVAGPPAIHQFENEYPFCSVCADKECLERMKSVLVQPEGEI